MAFHARTGPTSRTSPCRRRSPTGSATRPWPPPASTSPSTPTPGSGAARPWSRSPPCSPRPRSSTRWTSWPVRRSPSALVDGVASVRERVATGLAAEPRLPATGIDGRGRTRRRAAPRARGGAGAAHPGAGADPAGGGPGDVRTAGRRRRAGADHRRERAGQPDRTGPPRGAVGRAARHQRPPRGGGERGGGRGAGRGGGGPHGAAGPTPRRRPHARSARPGPRPRRPGCGCTPKWTRRRCTPWPRPGSRRTCPASTASPSPPTC